MTVATYVAASINVAVAAAAIICAWKLPIQRSASQEQIASTTLVHVAGASMRPSRCQVPRPCAEVVWTRLLSLLIGGTVYTFSIILAVFLIGLGIGSSWGAWLCGRNSPRLALGVCQLLLTSAIFWAAYQSVASLPYWPIDPSLSQSPWYSFQLDLIRSLWAILPPACLWVSFPLALAAAASPGEMPADWSVAYTRPIPSVRSPADRLQHNCHPNVRHPIRTASANRDRGVSMPGGTTSACR